jgi:hypothetical protein
LEKRTKGRKQKLRSSKQKRRPARKRRRRQFTSYRSCRPTEQVGLTERNFTAVNDRKTVNSAHNDASASTGAQPVDERMANNYNNYNNNIPVNAVAWQQNAQRDECEMMELRPCTVVRKTAEGRGQSQERDKVAERKSKPMEANTRETLNGVCNPTHSKIPELSTFTARSADIELLNTEDESKLWGFWYTC